MQAKWLSNSSDVSRRASEALENAVRSLSQPARARRLRQGLGVLFAIWCVFALSRLIWALLPAGDATLPADADIINPVGLPASAGSNSPVDIVRLQGWHLFGEAGAPDPAAQVPEIDTAAASGTLTKLEQSWSCQQMGIVHSSCPKLGRQPGTPRICHDAKRCVCQGEGLRSL